MLTVCVMFVLTTAPGVGFLSEGCYAAYDTYYEPTQVVLVTEEDNWHEYSEYYYYAPSDYYDRNYTRRVKRIARFKRWRRSSNVDHQWPYYRCDYSCRKNKKKAKRAERRKQRRQRLRNAYRNKQRKNIFRSRHEVKQRRSTRVKNNRYRKNKNKPR